MNVPPIDGTGVPFGSPERESTRLRQAAEAFESLFMASLIRQMRKAQLSQGFFGEGTGASTYEAMFEERLADRLSEGSPLGIADQLERLWTARGDGPREAARALDQARELLDEDSILKYPALSPIREERNDRSESPANRPKPSEPDNEDR